MRRLTRREFVASAAAAMGATAVWSEARPARSRVRWVERRDVFAQGVASGDPGVDSVLLWTRVSSAGAADSVALTVEVAEDAAFERVVASAPARVLAAADHTCRVLVGGRHGRVRVRVHPAASRAERGTRRRPVALPRVASRAAVAQGRAPAPRATRDRRGSGDGALTRGGRASG